MRRKRKMQWLRDEARKRETEGACKKSRNSLVEGRQKER
jgi:hypothetical protein